MTSRSYTKSYSRKVSSVTPGSIQFDKLFRENSNRPSAAKSAGTVGKWGITSFTSIRSTNINGKKKKKKLYRFIFSLYVLFFVSTKAIYKIIF